MTATIRAAWLELVPVDPLGPVDAEGFHLLAVNLLEGRGFAIAWSRPFCPTTVRTPGYPLFLVGGYSLLGRSPAAVVRLQILLEVLTAALVIALARSLVSTVVSSRRSADLRLSMPHGRSTNLPAGLLAGFLYAFNGLTQRFTGYTLSETLLLPLITASLWLTVCLVRRPSRSAAALTGLAWGLALLTKPNIQFMVVAVGLLVTVELMAVNRRSLAWYRRILIPLTFWALLMAVVFPWMVRNRRLLGRWTLSTAFDENLARVSAVVLMAEMEGVAVEPWTETWEYYYRTFVARVGREQAWGDCLNAGQPLGPLSCVVGVSDCTVRMRRTGQISHAARAFVADHWIPYLRIHVIRALEAFVDPGHRLWYHVIMGRRWETTGVVPDIRARMAWSLSRWAVGDALSAFWTERVVDIPLTAGAIWWGLTAVRGVIGWFALRGLWRLRRQVVQLLLFGGALGYQVILPGPIAHDRFYAPVLTTVIALVVVGAAPKRL